LEHLRRVVNANYADRAEVELMQNQVPKIDAETMQPAEWPADPELEWCPPGHGDLYTALVGSGWLDRLLKEKRRYAFISNCDNLGAILNPGMLAYFADSGHDFLMEVTRRTVSDRKGGHLAERRDNGHLVLRELAQCPSADLESFQDIGRYRYFNTNSLWIRLDALRALVNERGGFLPLPIICNDKRVDPRDGSSKRVIQLETAMGAAIREFERSGVVDVPRRRFAPVKTTGDLLALRSDAYQLTREGRMQLVAERGAVPPHVTLSDDYKLVDSLKALGLPSLRGAESLTVEGPVRFGPRAAIEGRVLISNRGKTPLIVDRLVCDEEIRT
jgi:UDP-N-acetylglucosamine pyrophosphorylase